MREEYHRDGTRRGRPREGRGLINFERPGERREYERQERREADREVIPRKREEYSVSMSRF